MKKFEFKPFDKVLVRSGNNAIWKPQWYSHKDGKDYVTMDGSFNLQCIPYEGNEHLTRSVGNFVDLELEKNKTSVQVGDRTINVGLGDFVTTPRGGILICSGNNNPHEGRTRTGTVAQLCARGEKQLKLFKEGDKEFKRNLDLYEGSRNSTKAEQCKLISRMHEFGWDWDVQKKEIVDWKWIPNKNESYYSPITERTTFIVTTLQWGNDDNDKERLEKGWVFRTRTECQAMCDKLNKSIGNANLSTYK